MADKRLSTTMRIEIPPEVRGKLRRTAAAASIRRHPGAVRTADAARPGDDSRKAILDPEFQQLFQSVYDAAFITDMRGTVAAANARVGDIFGHQRDTLEGHGVVEFISGADGALIDTLRANLDNDRFTLIQAYCCRMDGSLFPAEISVNRLVLKQREYLCFFVRDITQRRQAEEAVRTVYNAIRNAGNGIGITDIEGKLEYVNPAALRIWGCAAEDELLKRGIGDLWTESEQVMQAVRQTLRETSWMGELTARRFDGGCLPLQVSAAVNRDADERLVGIVFSFVDISDRKRAEDIARESERQRIMLESIGTACHHLGQPATVLLASLGMMRKKAGGIDDDLRILLQQGLSSAEKLQSILHRLNTINEYRTVPYLDGENDAAADSGDRIIEL